MGSCLTTFDDPLGVDGTLAVARLVPGLHAIGVADPTRGGDADHLRRVEAVLAAGRVRALEGLPRLSALRPDHPGYRPYYELAERHRLPVVFHTGDTYSPRAKLRFAHPLGIDDVAVDHPKACFVLAHLGNPWLTDAAEVVYKNVNVWADLSGFAVGSAEDFAVGGAAGDAGRGPRRAGPGLPLRGAAQPLPVRQRLAAGADDGLPRFHRVRRSGGASSAGV